MYTRTHMYTRTLFSTVICKVAHICILCVTKMAHICILCVTHTYVYMYTLQYMSFVKCLQLSSVLQCVLRVCYGV